MLAIVVNHEHGVVSSMILPNELIGKQDRIFAALARWDHLNSGWDEILFVSNDRVIGTVTNEDDNFDTPMNDNPNSSAIIDLIDDGPAIGETRL